MVLMSRERFCRGKRGDKDGVLSEESAIVAVLELLLSSTEDVENSLDCMVAFLVGVICIRSLDVDETVQCDEAVHARTKHLLLPIEAAADRNISTIDGSLRLFADGRNMDIHRRRRDASVVDWCDVCYRVFEYRETDKRRRRAVVIRKAVTSPKSVRLRNRGDSDRNELLLLMMIRLVFLASERHGDADEMSRRGFSLKQQRG
jgi:hypothetical protein